MVHFNSRWHIPVAPFDADLAAQSQPTARTAKPDPRDLGGRLASRHAMKSAPWVVRNARQLVSALTLTTAVGTTAITSLAARAQGANETRILTLKQAFDAAWQRQPEARSANARRQAADAQALVARSWTSEPMALELSVKTDRLTGNQGGQEVVAGIAAPLWLPGERGRAQAVAQAERGAVDSRVGAAQWRVAGAVREAWWAAQRATLETTLAQARLANAEQLAVDVARRVKAGDLSRADQLQADGVVAAAHSTLAEARATHAHLWQALRALTGDAPAETLSVTAEPPAGFSERASTDHPSLRELADRTDLARRARELASVQTRANPELTLSATRNRGAFGEAYGQALALAVRIPFGSVDLQRVRRATAGAELAEAESQAELESSRIAADIAAADVRVGATRVMVDASEKRAALAVETRRIFEKSFRLGETDLPTRLRVELEAFEAERQLQRSRIDQAQGLSQLRQALGLLPE
jgi:outer membrane protein, heavy metal efflux system